MANLRFAHAIDDARPYGTHRYDVYGPKVHRRRERAKVGEARNKGRVCFQSQCRFLIE
jgi:hypothetical protein